MEREQIVGVLADGNTLCRQIVVTVFFEHRDHKLHIEFGRIHMCFEIANIALFPEFTEIVIERTRPADTSFEKSKI